jgi:hypothetical protein
MVFNLPLSINSNNQLLDLMAFTLGLRLDKAKYTSEQLRAICSVAPKLMKTKGSITSVKLLCAALMHADRVEGDFEITNLNGTELTIYITSYATCKEALQELLPYILPAGMTFCIKAKTKTNTIQATNLVD